MLEFGVTRVELGVQTLSDDLYLKIKRGHTIADVIEANQLLRDSAIKVAMHMMPGLFADEKQDLKKRSDQIIRRDNSEKCRL